MRAFKIALAKPSWSIGNFFCDVRKAFRGQVESLLNEHGIVTYPDTQLGPTNYMRESRVVRGCNIVKTTGFYNDIIQELDLDFCVKQGHEISSLMAINYIDRAYCELPSLLPFLREKDFSLGNVSILVQNSDYEIDLLLEEGLRITGYIHQISPKKKKSYLCLFGIHFDISLLDSLEVGDCAGWHQPSNLDEIRIGSISYPVIFICRRCGVLFTCACFSDYFTIAGDIERLLPYGNSEKYLKSQIEGIQIIEGACSLCSGKVPNIKYGHEMYYSSFLQRYLPYHTLLARRKLAHDTFKGPEHRMIENDLRQLLGYPKVGEKWTSETLLFNIVRTILSPREVVYHYRGKELQGLELDLWIPELLLGIEYQGEQHYLPLVHWGGEVGLRKREENDKRKKAICKQLGYTLIEFRHDEQLSEDKILLKLRKYIETVAY